MKKIMILLILIVNNCSKSYINLKNINKDINEDLVKAIINNDADKAIKFINKGANVNYIFNNKSVLELAIENKNLNVMKSLIENGSEINKDNIVKIYDLALEDFNYNIIDLIKDKYKLEEGLTNNNKYFLLLCYTSDADKVKKFIEKNNIIPIDVKDKSNRNALTIAAAGNKIDIFKILIDDYRLDINHKDGFGMTPLMVASKLNKKLIEFIIGKGANINSKNNDGITPLIIAILTKNSEIVEFLIEKGANINENVINGHTPLIIASLIRNIEVIKLLIEKGADIDGVNNEGCTPLMLVSEEGNKEILNLLIEKGANINYKNKFKFDETALILASKKRNIEIVRSLIEKGANIDEKDSDGYTALMVAVRCNQKNIVELLLEKGANINYKNSYGVTPLITASINGNIDMVKLLIEKGAKVNKELNNEWTALMKASQEGHINVVNFLIKKLAYINDKNSDGNTALALASERGQEEIVKILIEKGANIDDKNNNGYTALMIASRNNRLNIVRLLIEKGANINNRNNNKQTALIVASHHMHEQIVDFLLKKGANINIKDGSGFTALRTALEYKYTKIIELLILKGADIKGIKNIFLEDILLNNIKGKNIANCLLLINNYKNKINYKYEDKEGNNFLHYAVFINNIKISEELLKNGCDINFKNNSGYTPLDTLLSQKPIDESFVFYLIEKGAILNNNINGKFLNEILLPYNNLYDKLLLKPLIKRLFHDLNLSNNYKIKDVVKILRLKEEDSKNETQMIEFIKNVLIDPNIALNINQIKINQDNDQDVELNIEVFDEILLYFDKHDYWGNIVQRGIEKVKNDFKKKLLIIEQYKPINKPLLSMNSEERLQNTNFNRKKKLAKLLRLISRTAENGYNNDKIKFVVNQLLDIVACSEGSLEAIEDAIRYLSGEESTETKDIINDELMHLRYNILKEICMNKIKMNTNGIEEIVEITPHTFPQLVKEMSGELKLKVDYLDEYDYHFIYNKNEIVKLVLEKYKERIVEYIRDKLEENRVLWNKVRDYIERDIFKGRPVLHIENFIYDEDYKIKKEAVKALLIHLNLY